MAFHALWNFNSIACRFGLAVRNRGDQQFGASIDRAQRDDDHDGAIFQSLFLAFDRLTVPKISIGYYVTGFRCRP